MVREMGATAIVELFPWAYYHAEDGGIAWDHPDMVVNHAHAQGLNVVARIGLTPGWARPSDTSLTYLDEEAYPDFAEFAARFAAKEAFLKAIKTGWGTAQSPKWSEIEVKTSRQGAPELILSGKARMLIRKLRIKRMPLSLTHTKTHAWAVVILEA